VEHHKDQPPPVVCDMAGAADTPAERIAEYRRLFAQSLVGRDRTGTGIRFRFRADAGLEDWVRDLARREKACCAFFSFTVTTRDEEVWWDAAVIDDDMARQILDEFYRLPDTLARRATDDGAIIGRSALSQPAGGGNRKQDRSGSGARR
jgi:hypothetical protein